MLKFIIDTLFPAVCVICGADDVHFCDQCLGAIRKNIRFTTMANEPLDGLISFCTYSDKSIIAKLIHCFKYDFICELSDVLGLMMLESLADSSLSDFALCPVPLHKKRERWRGFNQSKLLANSVGKSSDYEVCELLRRIKYKRPQMELGRDERDSNVTDAFVLIEMVNVDRNTPIVLVDDVFTTGATMRECAKALKDAGFRLVYGLVIAQTV